MGCTEWFFSFRRLFPLDRLDDRMERIPFSKRASLLSPPLSPPFRPSLLPPPLSVISRPSLFADCTDPIDDIDACDIVTATAAGRLAAAAAPAPPALPAGTEVMGLFE